LNEQDGKDNSEDRYEESNSSTIDEHKTANKDTRMHANGLTFQSDSGSESEHEEPIDSQEICGGQ